MSAAPASQSPVRPPRLHRPDSHPSLPARRRSGWHQRLIDAEGGWRIGLRADSTLHAYLFVVCAIVTSGLVLGLAFTEWLLLAAACGLTLAAELFHVAIQTLAHEAGGSASPAARRAVRLSTAATLTIALTACGLAGAMLVHRLWKLFQ